MGVIHKEEGRLEDAIAAYEKALHVSSQWGAPGR